MNYEEACFVTVSKEEAKYEIKKHSVYQEDFLNLWDDFVKEYGDKENYKGKHVLDFLGY